MADYEYRVVSFPQDGPDQILETKSEKTATARYRKASRDGAFPIMERRELSPWKVIMDDRVERNSMPAKP